MYETCASLSQTAITVGGVDFYPLSLVIEKDWLKLRVNSLFYF